MRKKRRGLFFKLCFAVLATTILVFTFGVFEASAQQAGDASTSRLPSGIVLDFAFIPPGQFQMGGTFDRVHQVKLTNGFWMQKTEVTQTQWTKIMGVNPSRFSSCPNCPVEGVTWNEVQRFIIRLNQQDMGLTYRLPTEAEWEYTARAGRTKDIVDNLDSYAWFKSNSGNKTHPVGTKRPNAWGIYDMQGNVCEWVSDWSSTGYNYPFAARVVDPKGPVTGGQRVYRGGHFWSDGSNEMLTNLGTHNMRLSTDGSAAPEQRDHSIGFRLVKSPKCPGREVRRGFTRDPISCQWKRNWTIIAKSDQVKPINVKPIINLARSSGMFKETQGPRPRQITTSVGGIAYRAVDGNTDGNYSSNSVTHTKQNYQPFWQIDLGDVQDIHQIKIYNRTDCCSERLKHFRIIVSEREIRQNTDGVVYAEGGYDFQKINPFVFEKKMRGRFVRVYLNGNGILSLAEVQIFGTDNYRACIQWERGSCVQR